MAHTFNDGYNVIESSLLSDDMLTSFLGIRQAQIRICKLSGVDDSPETLDKGLWQFNLFDPQTCAAGSIFTPVGPWPSSKSSLTIKASPV